MTGPAWHRHCESWKRAADCALDEKILYKTLAVAWMITSLAFWLRLIMPKCLRKLIPGVAYKAPSGYARWSLMLTGISAACGSLDAILYLVHGNPDELHEGYRHQPVQIAGSVFLTVALMLCARAWCDVASVLVELSGLKQGSGAFTKPVRNNEFRLRVISFIRYGYALLTVIHIPITLFRAVAGQRNGTSFNEGIRLHTAWIAFSAGLMFTVYAVLMDYIARVWLRELPSARGIAVIGRVNLAEQLLYNVTLLCVAGLFYSDGYSLHGRVQAAYFALIQGLYWMMHVQVLLFYLLVDPTDPMYSHKAFRHLVGTTSRVCPLGDAAFFCDSEQVEDMDGSATPKAQGNLDSVEKLANGCSHDSLCVEACSPKSPRSALRAAGLYECNNPCIPPEISA